MLPRLVRPAGVSGCEREGRERKGDGRGGAVGQKVGGASLFFFSLCVFLRGAHLSSCFRFFCHPSRLLNLLHPQAFLLKGAVHRHGDGGRAGDGQWRAGRAAGRARAHRARSLLTGQGRQQVARRHSGAHRRAHGGSGHLSSHDCRPGRGGDQGGGGGRVFGRHLMRDNANPLFRARRPRPRREK